ncbi:zinc-binding dehydrogenase [Cupriavidus metallidurans]|nr:zinc-binding dehydrogenase [Cupriavidus metallidurans]QGS32413.1 zinc-binding dehydrogenase [Cupriavidus metallidurans]
MSTKGWPVHVASEGGPLAVGTRVASSCHLGGYAQFAVIQKSEAIVIPDGVSNAAALALRSNYPTSLYALREVGQLKAGETVLVHAAAGGVGSAAVALAKWLGARVIGTAGGAEKVKAALSLGADAVVDYRRDDWVDMVKQLAPQGVDVVYDPVGGEIGGQSLRCLAYGARYLIIGFAGGTLTQLPANRLLLKNATAHGVLWGEVRKRDLALAERLTKDSYDAYSAGVLQVLGGQGYSFSQAQAAMVALEGRNSVGKVWLDQRGVE